jgi:hypothetical protein
MKLRGRRGPWAGALVAALVLTGLGLGPAPVRADTTAQLESEKAQLLAELAAITPQEPAARVALAAAETAYTETATALGAEQTELATLNRQLASLSGQIATNLASVAADQAALATLVQAAYETINDRTLLTAVIDASSFSAAMASLGEASTMSHRLMALEAAVTRARTALTAERTQVEQDLGQATTLEQSLAAQANALEVVVVQRNALLESLTGPAQQIARQIAQIDAELNPGPPAPFAGGCGDGFAFGTCTYYVALRRCVPWFGNADQWLAAAAALGYPEGSAPAVGAIAVWGADQSGASYTGHVAYVVAVGPGPALGSLAGGTVPAGSFEVAEMNWAGAGGGWDRVDNRIVADPAVMGFIY